MDDRSAACRRPQRFATRADAAARDRRERQEAPSRGQDHGAGALVMVGRRLASRPAGDAPVPKTLPQVPGHALSAKRTRVPQERRSRRRPIPSARRHPEAGRAKRRDPDRAPASSGPSSASRSGEAAIARLAAAGLPLEPNRDRAGGRRGTSPSGRAARWRHTKRRSLDLHAWAGRLDRALGQGAWADGAAGAPAKVKTSQDLIGRPRRLGAFARPRSRLDQGIGHQTARRYWLPVSKKPLVR